MTLAIVATVMGVGVAAAGYVVDEQAVSTPGAVLAGAGILGLLAILSWLHNGEISLQLPFVAFRFGLGSTDDGDGPKPENHLTVYQQVSTNRWFIEVPADVVERRQREVQAQDDAPAAARAAILEMVAEVRDLIGAIDADDGDRPRQRRSEPSTIGD